MYYCIVCYLVLLSVPAPPDIVLVNQTLFGLEKEFWLISGYAPLRAPKVDVKFRNAYLTFLLLRLNLPHLRPDSLGHQMMKKAKLGARADQYTLSPPPRILATPETMNDFSAIPDLYDATIQELLDGLDAGRFTVVQLVSAYISRIEEVNLVGPQLRAVLEVNAAALQQAAYCDRQRKDLATSLKGSRADRLGPLHGIPILVKDNIATASPIGWDERLNTSAGSLALLGCYPAKDATVIRKLREAGAIILGKTNMSDWANWRGRIPSGWSSAGGQCTNPYYAGAGPSGSSAGSGVAATIGLAAATLGTETDGSISCPSSLCNIVGLKPTVGLTSRAGAIPISKSQDSIGPMCRTVADTAAILQVITGPDARDPQSMCQPPMPDYSSVLNLNFIRGKRIGVLRGFHAKEPFVTPPRSAAFEEALLHLRRLGAELVDPVEIDTAEDIWNQREKECRVLKTEFKIGINEYLGQLVENPTGVHTLADVINFHHTHPETHFGGEERQDILIQSNESVADDQYETAIQFCSLRGGEEGIDACLKKYDLDVLITPHSDCSSFVSAVAGYPTLTVPLGFLPDDTPLRTSPGGFPVDVAPGLPFGITFLGGKWSERTLLGCGYALEQSMKVRARRRPIEGAIPRSQLPGFSRWASMIPVERSGRAIFGTVAILTMTAIVATVLLTRPWAG